MIALLLIDLQQGFDDINRWGNERNNLNAEENCRLLLDFFRANKLPFFHVQHCSIHKNSPMHTSHAGNQFKKIVQPLANENIIQKNVNSAFIGTNLKEKLEAQNISDVIVIGLTTDQCVSTTTRMSGNYGFNTYVISDATATFNKIGINGENYSAELIHLTALASLKDEFASVLTTAEMLQVLAKKIN